ncbi:hypothetical protein L950_0212060 [Sphingobacterium sp. IITKGP-BTPF85]|nr:hypothetical protein L950_0212060 [Sphingobacterium sp. IITKGP-BTPF85]
MNLKFMASVGFMLALNSSGFGQVLNLSDALQRAVDQHDKIKSKRTLVQSAEQNTIFQNKQFLPDVTLGAQQSYGTINAQNGPMYAHGGLASAATSMPLAEQNWNAAFGSLYFANVNWNVFTFGKKQIKWHLPVQRSRLQLLMSIRSYLNIRSKLRRPILIYWRANVLNLFRVKIQNVPRCFLI